MGDRKRPECFLLYVVESMCIYIFQDTGAQEDDQELLKHMVFLIRHNFFSMFYFSLLHGNFSLCKNLSKISNETGQIKKVGKRLTF